MPNYHRSYQPFQVFFDGALQEHVQVQTIRRSAGGARVDAAELQMRLDRGRLREGLGFNGAKLPNVEVRRPSDGRVLFAGKLTQIPLVLDQTAEHLDFVVRLEPFCFGDPVGFLPCYVTTLPNGTVLALHRPLVFNPEIDDRVRGNRHVTADGGELYGHAYVFLEYDSTRTERSRSETWQGEPVVWSLADIAFYLCWVLNPGQEFVFNPSRADLAAVFSTSDAVRNFSVKHGDYLSDVLDDLLGPRGYHWFVEHVASGYRVLRFFRRGTGYGNPAFVQMSPAGGLLDPQRDNCCAAHLQYDQGNLANRVRIRGAPRQYEVTVELLKGWDDAHDLVAASDPEALRLDASNVQFRDVWRKWVLNESGDYTGLRPEIARHFDLGTLLGVPNSDFWVPRRRKFLPCITRGVDDKPAGDRGGCVVEYFDEVENTWRVVDSDMEFTISHDECAIWFTGTYPPEQLYGSVNPRVRITATLESDQPLVSQVAQSHASPTSDRIPLALDLGDYFQYREVTFHSQFYSRVRSGELRADEIDDTLAINLYAHLVLDAWDYGQVRGTLVIEGVDRDFELGQPVQRLAGRNFDFNGRVSSSSATPKYPTIVGITYACQQQKTYLQIEQFRRHTLPEVG
jgi:hypothetical protein